MDTDMHVMIPKTGKAPPLWYTFRSLQIETSYLCTQQNGKFLESGLASLLRTHSTLLEIQEHGGLKDQLK